MVIVRGALTRAPSFFRVFLNEPIDVKQKRFFRVMPRMTGLMIVLLAIEFLDEFVFGIREAGWPLIRDDLDLSYAQIGVLLSLPRLLGSVVEPPIGILGDVWKRRWLILSGGVVFVAALVLISASQSFLYLLVAFILFYPASGAFVNLSQATLMDSETDRHEQNMACGFAGRGVRRGSVGWGSPTGRRMAGIVLVVRCCDGFCSCGGTGHASGWRFWHRAVRGHGQGPETRNLRRA